MFKEIVNYFKRRKFNQICKDIKTIKIQGARNIAIAALEAYFMFPTKATKKKLLSLRPTEPMLARVLNEIEKSPKEKVLAHFNEAQNKINLAAFDLIHRNKIVVTHCHSTNVLNALIYARKLGKHFEVYASETRPLFQGRLTAKDLGKANIPVTLFIDSAIGGVISHEHNSKRISAIFIGSDAITKNGVINKIGSASLAEIAKNEKIPFYVVADSWKYSKDKVPIEQRSLNEVWDKAPAHVKIKNPAFEFVDKKYITKIVTEFGVLSFDEFLKKVK